MPLKPKARGAKTPDWHEKWMQKNATRTEVPEFVRPQGRGTDNRVPK